MNIQELYTKYLECTGVSTDSRNIEKGVLFVALKGENFNGNQYAHEALKKGARYALVDEEITGENILHCNDCVQTLQALATHHRRQFSKPIIGLTGSNGKTTSKELITCVLSKRLKTYSTSGNYNNHIGVPLTLLALPLDSEVAIIEMGANHQKEIDLLSHIAEPNWGIITNIGKAHLEGFGGIEGVIKGKSELYDFIKKTNGKIIVNGEDEVLQQQVGDYSYTLHYYPSQLTIKTDDEGYLSVIYQDKVYPLQLTGSYNLANISCAITCGLEFGISIEESLSAISAYIPSNNRSEIKKIGNITVVMDAYNANPTSMKASLQSFNRIKAGNKIIVMGEMLELGDASILEHQLIVDFLLNLDPNCTVYLIGKEWDDVSSSYTKFENVESFINTIDKHRFNNSALLLKGSRGVKLERVLEQLV